MAFLGVLFVVFGVGISIALHELGHLIPARRFGVAVRQYMIGFGPTLWSRRKGETEYGLKAVPLGGYVRMIGMLPPRRGEDPSRLRASSTGRFSQLADQARKDSLEDVRPGEEDRVFYKLSAPKKMLVMLGGPLVNLALGAALLTGYVTMYGVLDPDRPASTSVARVLECATPTGATGDQSGSCAGVAPTPAFAAGLKAGDRIVSIEGRPVRTVQDVSALVRPNPGRPLTVVVDRAGTPLSLTVTPTTADLPRLDANGAIVRDGSGAPLTEKAGYLGISQRQSYQTVRQPISEAPRFVWQVVSGTAGVVVNLPEKLVGVWQAVTSGQDRDPSSPVSVVGVGRVAGEKAGGEPTGSLLDDIGTFPFLIQLLGLLNIALFVFNLIPLVPLDGGHVAGAAWEGIRRTVARVLRRPDPGYVDVAKALPLAYAVSVLLITMAVLLIYADIVKPIRL